jgi:hypothetical protein
MASYSDVTKQIGDLWVDAIKRAEDAVTQVARTRPATAARAAAPRSAFGRELPSLREVIEANFELAERLLRAQKEYALRALESAVPESAAAGSRAKTSAKASSSRSAAKRGTAKKRSTGTRSRRSTKA